MLTKEQLSELLLYSATTGADFAELYFEDTDSAYAKVLSGKVDEVTKNKTYGVALRLLHGVEESYGYTNDISYEGIKKLADKVKGGFSYPQTVKEVSLKEKDIERHTTFRSLEADMTRVCGKLTEITDALSSYDPRIIQAAGLYTGSCQRIVIANSDGVYAEDTRFVQRITAQAVSRDENSMQSASDNHGGNFDFETLMEFDYIALAKEVAELAIKLLTAKDIAGGVYDVVIHNAFGGVIFHEACGHSLEATSVARDLSVFSGKLGEKIASDVVTAIDDGTIANEWGSENIDDEGEVQRKRVLIENGILKSYMIDKRNARRMNCEPTGSSRRQSYKYSPTSRMSNTYIANGQSKPEEIIAATKSGIFAKRMGGGSVNPVTGEFNFSVLEGYMIEDGRITDMVRGATLIGNGKDTLLMIDMVADNMSFGYGMCGSLSGSIPACVGQPTIRVKNMTVGGKG